MKPVCSVAEGRNTGQYLFLMTNFHLLTGANIYQTKMKRFLKVRARIAREIEVKRVI
jgi:hypothetical protein